MKRRGFSLIELLVVVGVVALIAAILFPVFMRARGGDSKKSSCMNNLKQLGLGFLQYTQDYNERLPFVVSSSVYALDNPATASNETSFYGWADTLQPYVKSVQVYHCSTMSHANGNPTTFAPLARDCTDYWLNGRIAGLSLMNVKSPAQTLALAEGNDGGDMTDARYNYSALPAPWINDQNSPVYRHVDGANYCFMDGHVKYIKPSEISMSSQAKWRFTP
jgi:prepilin-type N-terminal cleavage/methylation domain-containing protein/prepilin-type processing-associated H-X9-DG protein